MVSFGQIDWINRNLMIEDYLSQLNIDIPHNGKCFCPFHHNVNTPAAKVYTSEQSGDGGRLYCYTERRSYTVYDVIKLIGYTDEQIHKMVPREHWYTVQDNMKQEDVPIPIVDKVARNAVQGGVFGVLIQLDYMWENPKRFKCMKL